MNKENLEAFVHRFPEFSKWNGNKQTDYFAYFLTGQEGLQSFTGKDLQECFDLLSINRFARLRVYLSEHAGSDDGKYVKQPVGYRLERTAFEAIKREIEEEPLKVEVSQELKNLLNKVADPIEKAFLEEVICCYSVGAHRASIVLCWILAMHHLQAYIFTMKLAEFNRTLTQNPDKRVKVIGNADDFSDLPESRFIELARAANVISNDIMKVLNEKLGTRNTAAHPSTIVITPHKTTEFISDLVNNVLLKY